MKTKSILLLGLILSAFLMSSGGCDKRGGVSTGIPEYLVDISAAPLIISQSDSSFISVVVHGYTSNDPIGGVEVEFFTLDFGWVVASAFSSSSNPTGLEIPVYFIPLDTTGSARVIATVSSGPSTAYTDSDTVTITVY